MTSQKIKKGRPLLYNNCLDLQMHIEMYIDKCEEDSRPLTITGLANAIGIDRKSLLNYSHKEDFFPTIKRYRGMVEQFLEENLYSSSVAGIIFNLKNNFGWTDKQELNVSSKNINVNAESESAQEAVRAYADLLKSGNE